MKNEEMRIVAKHQLTQDVFEFVLEGDLVNEHIKAGQFLNIKVPREDLILRRPISISSIHVDKRQLTIVLRAQGEGTQSICKQEVGETLDVLGALGHGFPIDSVQAGQQVLIVGGGIGIPPLLEVSKQLSNKGAKLTILLGFQTCASVFYEDVFRLYGQVWISSDDGSIGSHGTVETILNDQLKDRVFDAVFACGPIGLNRMINERYQYHSHAYISLEERMACGIGACAACTCQKANTDSENVKVCSDGPVFKTNEVIV